MDILILNSVNSCFLDPLGRSVPKLPVEDRHIVKEIGVTGTVTMPCIAQASPSPNYRWRYSPARNIFHTFKNHNHIHRIYLMRHIFFLWFNFQQCFFLLITFFLNIYSLLQYCFWSEKYWSSFLGSSVNSLVLYKCRKKAARIIQIFYVDLNRNRLCILLHISN